VIVNVVIEVSETVDSEEEWAWVPATVGRVLRMNRSGRSGRSELGIGRL
jgi:hypothetical protein